MVRIVGDWKTSFGKGNRNEEEKIYTDSFNFHAAFFNKCMGCISLLL